MRLEAEMSTWEIPLYLADKKLVNSVVDEADIAFFVEWVPASLEMGIETEFHMNDKFMPSGVILEGAFMAQLTSESIAMALGGKMKGTWRMDQYPAATYDGQTVDFRIPCALENVAGKIGISADDTYSFGGRGTAYIGEKSKAKSITLGGKLGLQYDGVDVHPTYFGFLGGVNSPRSETWSPWAISIWKSRAAPGNRGAPPVPSRTRQRSTSAWSMTRYMSPHRERATPTSGSRPKGWPATAC